MKFGLYKHYKGGLYLGLGIVRNSTNGPDEGLTYMLYFSLRMLTFHIREYHQWFDRVMNAEGEPCFRFTKLV